MLKVLEITSKSISFEINESLYRVSNTHPYWQQLRHHIIAGDQSQVQELIKLGNELGLNFSKISSDKERDDSLKSRSLGTWVSKVQLAPDGTINQTHEVSNVLKKLVAFDTTSSHDPSICKSNSDFVMELKTFFEERKIEHWVSTEQYHGQDQSTLVAWIGPKKEGGVLFSSHTDVVPADIKTWSTKPFELVEQGTAYYGRGTVDTKSNIVSNLILAEFLSKNPEKLEKPVYFAFSWGEEIGCKGTSAVTDILTNIKATPEVMIIGEPTDNKLAIGHKGGSNLNITINGLSGHSSQPRKGINAIYQSAEVITFVMRMNEKFQEDIKYHDENFDPPYPVVNLGYIQGGTSPNTIPGKCELGIHVRPVPGFDMEKEVVEPFKQLLTKLEATMIKQEETIKGKGCERHTGTSLVKLSYTSPLPVQAMTPALENVIDVHRSVTGDEDSILTVSYASEAGNMLVWAETNMPGKIPAVIVNGPGDMVRNKAHASNEFIAKHELLESVKFPLAITRNVCLSKEIEQNLPGTVVIPVSEPEKIRGKSNSLNHVF